MDLSLHRFLSILGLFPVTFSVFLFILLRFDLQSSLSHIFSSAHADEFKIQLHVEIYDTFTPLQI